MRCCARPPFALERLHLVGDQTNQLLHILPSPAPDGPTALPLSALEILDRLAALFLPRPCHSMSPGVQRATSPSLQRNTLPQA